MATEDQAVISNTERPQSASGASCLFSAAGLTEMGCGRRAPA